MDVFKLLPKINCRSCNKPTCLAFATAVFQGHVSLDECPFLEESLTEDHDPKNQKTESDRDLEYQQALESLQAKLRETDLKERAERLQGSFADNRLTLKIMGKDFSVDSNGDISTILHVNRWLVMPVFYHILYGEGIPLQNAWVPFRELESSKDWVRFFEHQCVGLLKTIADTNPSFFEDVIELFNARPVVDHYEADISIILEPLPLFPILICYNHPEEGLLSSLNLFFDSTADKNLPVESIFTLTAGLARMLEKLAQTHA